MICTRTMEAVSLKACPGTGKPLMHALQASCPAAHRRVDELFPELGIMQHRHCQKGATLPPSKCWTWRATALPAFHLLWRLPPSSCTSTCPATRWGALCALHLCFDLFGLWWRHRSELLTVLASKEP